MGESVCVRERESDEGETHQKSPPPPLSFVSSLWLWGSVGLAFMLLFCALFPFLPTYRTRTFLPGLWLPPPRLTLTGCCAAFAWLPPTLTASDAVLLESAGLDALMLTWTFRLGMQIFGPLAVAGLAVLLPVNLTGGAVKAGVVASATAGRPARPGYSTFSKFTMTNLAPGSPRHWASFAFMYAAAFYTCWLLRRYYRAYVVLRQRYLTGGEVVKSMAVSVFSFTLLGSCVQACDPNHFSGPFVTYVREDDDYDTLARRMAAVTGEPEAEWSTYRLAVVHNKTPSFIPRGSAAAASTSPRVTGMDRGANTLSRRVVQL